MLLAAFRLFFRDIRGATASFLPSVHTVMSCGHEKTVEVESHVSSHHMYPVSVLGLYMAVVSELEGCSVIFNTQHTFA